MKPVLSIMIRTGPPLTSSGFRTKLNEFHSQLYVNVDPPNPPSTVNYFGANPILAQLSSYKYTLVSDVNIFIKESSLVLDETVSGFYISFGPWGVNADTIPMIFSNQYSAVVKQLCGTGKTCTFLSVPGEDVSFYLRWGKTGVKVYFNSTSALILSPQADLLAKPSSAYPGFWDLTALSGQSCLSGDLERVEDTSTQKFRLEFNLFSDSQVSSVGLDQFVLLRPEQPYNLPVTERLFLKFVQ